jgi:hypothetical protein
LIYYAETGSKDFFFQNIVDVTVCLLVLLRSSILSSERPRDIFLRRPIKVNRIKGRCALFGQFLPITGIFTRLSRFGAELGEEFVYG